MVRPNKAYFANGTRRAASTGTGRRPRLGSGTRSRTLHELLDRMGDGTIAEIEDLAEEEVRLLHAYYGEGEDIQTLLDRLRVSGREEHLPGLPDPPDARRTSGSRSAPRHHPPRRCEAFERGRGGAFAREAAGRGAAANSRLRRTWSCRRRRAALNASRRATWMSACASSRSAS
jgi:hypothetical protein